MADSAGEGRGRLADMGLGSDRELQKLHWTGMEGWHRTDQIVTWRHADHDDEGAAAGEVHSTGMEAWHRTEGGGGELAPPQTTGMEVGCGLPVS